MSRRYVCTYIHARAEGQFFNLRLVDGLSLAYAIRLFDILADLDRDILPGERRGKKSAPLNQEEVLDRAAGTHAEHLAGPTMIEVVGRGGGARRSNASEGANAGAGGGSSGTAGGRLRRG